MKKFDHYFKFISKHYDNTFFLNFKTKKSNFISVYDGCVKQSKSSYKRSINVVLNDDVCYGKFCLVDYKPCGSIRYKISKKELKESLKKAASSGTSRDLFITSDSSLYNQFNIHIKQVDINLVASLFIEEFKKHQKVLSYYFEIDQEFVDSFIKNSECLILKSKSLKNFISVNVLVEINGLYNSSSINIPFNDISDLDFSSIILSLVDEASKVYNKISLENSNYDILFSAKAVSTLITPIFFWLFLHPDVIKDINVSDSLKLISDSEINFFKSSKSFDHLLVPSIPFNLLSINKDNFFKQNNNYLSRASYFTISGTTSNINDAYKENKNFIHVLDIDERNFKFHFYDTYFAIQMSGIVVQNGEVLGSTTFVLKETCVTLLNKFSKIYDDFSHFYNLESSCPLLSSSILFKQVSCFDSTELKPSFYEYSSYIRS